VNNYLVIAIGGALGSVLRFAFSGCVANPAGQAFLGTMLVNVSGSFIIGLFASLTGSDGRWTASPMMRNFFMIGICGGYTTFSSFSLQTLELMQGKQWLQAGANTLFSVILCLVAVWLGYILGALVSAKGG